MPVSVGISLSKTLAKLASERAKKRDGAYIIKHREISNELRKTPLIDIWGIGNNTAEFLNKYGFKTGYDITLIENSKIKNMLGKKGLELKYELIGQSVYPVSDKYIQPKSIQKTSSFAKFTSDETYIKKSLHYHTHRACVKLRKLRLKTKIVGIMLRTKDFKVYIEKVLLLQPTDWEFDINKAVNLLFERVYIPDVIYRSSGVYLENLTEDSQISLFSSIPDIEKNKRLAESWDKLENKYGRGVIVTG